MTPATSLRATYDRSMSQEMPGIYDADLPPLPLRRSDALGRLPADRPAPAESPEALTASSAGPNTPNTSITTASPATDVGVPVPSEPADATPTAAPVPNPSPASSVPPKPSAIQAPDDAGKLGESGVRLPPVAWGAIGIGTAVAGFAWISHRKKVRALREQHDSVFWANVQPALSSMPIDTQHSLSTEQFIGDGPLPLPLVSPPLSLDDILPDSPDPGEAARSIYVTGIGETTSRREATLIDLHQLERRLHKRLKRGNVVAATLLLQEHLVDFRYTSPWVFLELLELYRKLSKQNEWNIARDAFRNRFGQNAPLWQQPPTANDELLNDGQLVKELIQVWPTRATRIWVLRWMLGDHHMRDVAGPPLLGLGAYRDMMCLDGMLDDLMPVRGASVEHLPPRSDKQGVSNKATSA